MNFHCACHYGFHMTEIISWGILKCEHLNTNVNNQSKPQEKPTQKNPSSLPPGIPEYLTENNDRNPSSVKKDHYL